MLRLSDLLSSASRPDLQQLLTSAPPLAANSDAAHCLISGPPRSGKTSVLFHLAHACAARGNAVLLLCRRARLELAPPLLPEGVPHTAPAWGRVAIKYLDNGAQHGRALGAGALWVGGRVLEPAAGARCEARRLHVRRQPAWQMRPPPTAPLIARHPCGATHPPPAPSAPAAAADQLLKYLSALHLLPDEALPSAILVDDLHELCDLSVPDARSAQRHSDMGLCRLLALLADTAAHLGQRAGRPCLLAAAELGGAEGPRSPFLTRRWLPLTVVLRPVGAGHHRLTVLAPAAVAAQQMQVDYSLCQSSLVVEALHPPPSPASVLPH